MRESYFALACLLSGFSQRKILALLEKTKSFERLWKASKKELLSFGLSQVEAEKFLSLRKNSEVDDCWGEVEKKRMGTVCLIDSHYPRILKEIDLPPLVLFYQGNLLERERVAVAVVGSRLSSSKGKYLAKELSKELSKRGFTVVSGLARGIDTSAHLGSLEGEGKTIAVLGCGLDVDYPPDNRALKRKITEEGCVLTEFLPGTEPFAYNFPLRNRIIAGLSRAVIVVEARLRSGALITAHLAADYGREVMAFPGGPENPYSRGCNRLIKEGAYLVENLDDVLGVLGYTEKSASDKVMIGLSESERKILSFLKTGSKQIDEIIRVCGPEAISLLTLLEVKGAISREVGQVYSLNLQVKANP